MTNYGTFKEYLDAEYGGPFPATDIVIRHNDGKKYGIVLIERKFLPHGLALPGGIAESMTFEENAIKEAKEETGLDVVLDQPTYRPLCVFSRKKDDFRAHIASITYTAQGFGILKPMENEDAKSAVVYTLDEIVELLPKKNIWAFNSHKRIITIYLKEKGIFPKDFEVETYG